MNWDALSGALSEALQHTERPSDNPDNWEPDFLAEYIVQTHHRYLREHLPLICQYAAKTAAVHGERHPELKVVQKQVELLAGDLLEHMEKEEKVLFPYIRMLCDARRQHTQVPAVPFQSAQAPISMMEHEHDYAGALLENLRELTNDFTPPADSCTTYKLTYAKLKELDEDLRWHVHLENNVLFPKTIRLEQILHQQN